MPTFNAKRKTLNAKRKLLFIFLLLVFNLSLITCHLSLSYAQTPTALQKAQDDYNFQTGQYKNAHDTYTAARSEYLTFQTAISKDIAYQTTKNYLIQVDLLNETFIALVQENANGLNWDNANVSKVETNTLLTEETAFFKNNEKKVNAVTTLEELPPIAKDVKDHITTTASPKVNKVLATMEIVQAQSVFFDFNNLASTFDKIVAAKLSSGETQSVLSNWSTETTAIKTQATQKIQNAQKIYTQNNTPTMDTGVLNSIVGNTQNIKGDLKKSITLFEELTRII